MTQTRNLTLGALAAGLLTGCVTRVPIVELGHDHDEGDAAVATHEPLTSCTRGGYCKTLEAVGTNKLDLLFVIDNSPSMAGEQALLAAQLPKLLTALQTGQRGPDDPHPFLPPTDMHIGVVTTDLGLSGVDGVPMCTSDGGDGARLQHVPKSETCDAIYPTFLSFLSDPSMGVPSDPDVLASDLSCITKVGTAGCSVRQPLEAALKALWPASYTDADGHVLDPNPITFLSTSPEGMLGLGDLSEVDGGNRGFVRTVARDGLSLLSIIVITDGDDCSMRNTDSFRPEGRGADGEPLTDPNLRCFHNKNVLHDTVTRYATWLPKLRPERPDLVTFSAIVGVPTDLVDTFARGAVNMRDESERNKYYDAILKDPRMQEVVDPSTRPGTGTGQLTPSCVRASASGVNIAYPPRRIVEVAKGFGENGLVQSICQDDLSPVLTPILDNMAPHFSPECLPNRLARKADGKVACDVIWELPKTVEPGSPVPSRCEAHGFLSANVGSRPTTNDMGGSNCLVKQVSVSEQLLAGGEGWYYDDWSSDAERQCAASRVRRIAFTDSAKPPVGVRVIVDCASDARLD